MPRPTHLHAFAATLIAGGVGFALNRYGLDFFGHTEMVFGGFLPLAVAWLFGPAWGAAAALLAASATVGPWHHPWGVVFATTEAFVAGWLVQRRRTSGPGAVVRFWIFGAPAAAALFLWGHALPFPTNWAVALTFPANGLLNALLASSVATLLLRQPWWTGGAAAAPRHPALARVLFQRFASFAVLPMAAVALLAGRAFDRQVRQRAAVEIGTAAQSTAVRLDAFLREHERAVATLADQLALRSTEEGPEQLDLALFQLRRRYPSFVATVVADATGVIVAASPDRGVDDRPIARAGVSVADRDSFRRPVANRQAFVSGVFRGRGFGQALIVALSAPIIRHGRVTGVLEASVNLDHLCADLNELAAAADRDLLVTDSVERIVLNRGIDDLVPLDSFAHSPLDTASDAANSRVFQHDLLRAGAGHTECMLVGSAQAGLSGWNVYLQEPLWRSMRVVAGFYLGALLMCGTAAAGVLWLARRTVATITRPLEHLATATRALASGHGSPPPMPTDAPDEIARIADDVGAAARQMSDHNRQLTTAMTERERLNRELNELLRELDDKVKERTEALAAKNAELQRLVVTQQETQRAVAASDRRYRTVLEHLSEVVFQADREGRWTLLSPAWTRITGFPIEAAQGHGFTEFLHLDDREECQEQFRALFAGDSPEWIRRARFHHEDGSYCWVQISARLTRDDHGTVTGAAGTLSDVTELVEHEEALRLSRRRFDLAVRGSGAGLWDWDLDTGMFYFSPRAKELIGYADHEFSNHSRDWMRVLHPEDQPRVLRALRRSVAGRNPLLEMEFRLRHRDGTWRWIHGRGAALRDDQGRTLRLAGSFTDVSDRRRAQAALEERSAELSVANAQLARAARLKDEFLASMSHELRTPLNAVLGMAEVLSEEIPGPLVPAQRDCVQTIAESGRHLLALINDILDLSKIEAGKIVIDCEPVPLREIVRASLRFIKESALKKNLQVCEDFRQTTETVVADSRRLKQILINLLANAVKFTPEGGRVGIEVWQPPERDAVAFTVWDTGIGIAAADLAGLFQPFVQVDSKLSRQFGGTGLGLAIVRKLAELHDGSVAVESVPGHGSRFTVVLPLAPSPSGPTNVPAAAPAAELPARDPLRPLRVLLVEDNERTIAAFRQYLEAHGCAIAVAATGPEGLDLARHTPVDVVVLDLQLPGMDGFEVLQALRQHPATAALPVVALTALNMPGARARCLAAGARAHLEKPVRLPVLFDLLRAVPRAVAPPAGVPPPITLLSS